MITGIDHATIATTRLDETTAFFVKILGLEVGRRPNFGVPGEWLYAGGRPILHLVEEASAREPRGGIDHFSFAIDDFDRALARLEKAGVKYVALDIPDGFGRQVFVKDPNGLTIELTWRNPRTA